MVENSVLLARVGQLSAIFNSKNWLRGNRTDVAMGEAFERACELASRLSVQQFDLFQVLLIEFQKIDYESYIPSLSAALSKVTLNDFTNTHFRALPLVSPEDIGKNKSGPSLVYSFANTVWRNSEIFRRFKLSSAQSTEIAKKDFKGEGTLITFVVDDFIGTGDTALKYLAHYREHHMHANERLIVLSIAAMSLGVKTLRDLGHEIYFDILVEKGIEQCLSLADKVLAYTLMDQIETMIQVSAKFKYGYRKSEALISMMRTPNNTFPLFWAARDANGSAWPALFPR